MRIGAAFEDELKAAGIRDKVFLWTDDGRVECDPSVYDRMSEILAAHNPDKPSAAQVAADHDAARLKLIYQGFGILLDAIISIVDNDKKPALQALLTRLEALKDSHGH